LGVILIWFVEKFLARAEPVERQRISQPRDITKLTKFATYRKRGACRVQVQSVRSALGEDCVSNLANFGMRALRDMWAGSLPEKDRKILREAHTANCVYCGVRVSQARKAKETSSEPERFDHIVPVSKRGRSVVGNIVLACASCDDSRQDQPWEAWIAKINGSESGLKRCSLDPVVIQKRMDSAREYLRKRGCSLAFNQGWFEELTPDLRKKILELEENIRELDKKASEIAQGVREALGKSEIHAPSDPP
jgi:5-methylcytosine-specific restriction endonuclease McrA